MNEEFSRCVKSEYNTKHKHNMNLLFYEQVILRKIRKSRMIKMMIRFYEHGQKFLVFHKINLWKKVTFVINVQWLLSQNSFF